MGLLRRHPALVSFAIAAIVLLASLGKAARSTDPAGTNWVAVGFFTVMAGGITYAFLRDDVSGS